MDISAFSSLIHIGSKNLPEKLSSRMSLRTQELQLQARLGEAMKRFWVSDWATFKRLQELLQYVLSPKADTMHGHMSA